MFVGEHRHALDDKGRVIFPARMRDELGAQVYLQKGLERCIYVVPPDEWERQIQEMTSLPRTDPRARSYNRFFFSQASAERIDKQGRLTIPSGLREYAELDKNLVIAGAGRRVEIWGETQWDDQLASAEANMTELASELGI